MLQQLTRRNLFIALTAIILLLGIGATTIFLINRSRPGGQTTTPVVRIEAATTAQTGIALVSSPRGVFFVWGDIRASRSPLRLFLLPR